jgi:GNAT superfamily N-acetyltransferase
MAPSDRASDTALAFDTLRSAADMADANSLIRAAHWNQIEADWRVFLDHGTVYAVRDQEGRVIATAATLPHGGFAWVSMVLVAPKHRRKALGTKLLRRCIDDLLARSLVPVLDATPAGREVYRPLGFLDAWGFHRLALRERKPADESQSAGTPSPMPKGVTIQTITDAVWPALCRYDAEVFGADRSKLLDRLRGRSAAEFVATRGGGVVGFLLGRDGRVASQLGPLIADDDATAQALLARGQGAVDGPLYIDIPDAKAALLAFLAGQGFTPERPFTRMLHGRSIGFEDAARTYAVVGPEFG